MVGLLDVKWICERKNATINLELMLVYGLEVGRNMLCVAHY